MVRGTVATLAMAVAVGASLAACGAEGSTKSCWYGTSDCPPCPASHNISFDTLMLLGWPFHEPGAAQFAASMDKAQHVVEAGANTTWPGAHMTNNALTWHSTLSYFCCHSEAEADTILRVLKAYPWEPFNMTFAGSGCSVKEGGYTSFYGTADDATQARVLGLVRGMEAALRAAGVNVTHPREEWFHSTLGIGPVDLEADALVAALNASVPVYNPTQPIRVDWFTSLTFKGVHYFNATGAAARTHAP